MIHCASIYGVFLLLIAIPFVQDQYVSPSDLSRFGVVVLTGGIDTRLIYMHNARWPWNANFSAPEEYGLDVGRARNVPLTTSDNVTLGSWHVLPPT